MNFSELPLPDGSMLRAGDVLELDWPDYVPGRKGRLRFEIRRIVQVVDSDDWIALVGWELRTGEPARNRLIVARIKAVARARIAPA
jgi:hypothetical protein